MAMAALLLRLRCADVQPYFSNARLALTNPRVRGSITSVSAENFGRGGNEGWRHGVEEHELRESRVMTANLPVVPSRESLHAGTRQWRARGHTDAQQ